MRFCTYRGAACHLTVQVNDGVSGTLYEDRENRSRGCDSALGKAGSGRPQGDDAGHGEGRASAVGRPNSPQGLLQQVAIRTGAKDGATQAEGGGGTRGDAYGCASNEDGNRIRNGNNDGDGNSNVTATAIVSATEFLTVTGLKVLSRMVRGAAMTIISGTSVTGVVAAVTGSLKITGY